MMGQNNHFLITILVGLDCVETGQATLSPTFSTSWSPRSAKTSARRSRDFAIKALLAWAADSLDAYRRHLITPPGLYLTASECDSVKAQQGLWPRFKCLADLSGAPLAPEKDMVELLVVWRNKVVHTNSRDAITGELSRRLLENQSRIGEKYRDLHIRRAMDAAAHGAAPTFKEITALVSAAHELVKQVDSAVVARIDLDHYFRSALATYVAADPAKRTDNIWGRDPVRRRTSLLQIAQNAGMSTRSGDRTISSEFINELVTWTPKDARRELSSE
ncbi:hypothetical protein [Mycobacterium simiae]|nr:hypothetical protein [Mycobacterium simiae]